MYFGSKYDVYKTNADLYGEWCFITSFQISCNTKKDYEKCNTINYIFPNYVFQQNISFSTLLNFSYTFLMILLYIFLFVFHFSPFQFLSCISCYAKNFYYFLGGSHLFYDSFFIFKENTL